MTRGTRVYLFGLGCLGLTIGLIVGLSQSEISGTVLTALFALIGAGAIFYVPWSGKAAEGTEEGGESEAGDGAQPPKKGKTSAKPKDEKPSDPFLAPGAALVAFSLTLAVAMIYGSVVRTNGSLGDFWPYRETVAIPANLSASGTLDAVILDRLMLRLGIDSSGRTAVLGKLGACSGTPGALTTATTEAFGVIEPLLVSDPARYAKLVTPIKALHDKLVPGGAAPDGGEAMDGTYRSEASAVVTAVARFRGTDAEWLAGEPAAAAALDALEATATQAIGCEPSSSVVAEFVRTLKDLQETPLSGSLVTEPGIENIGTVQMY